VYRLLNPLGFVRPRPDQLAIFQGGPSRTGGGDEHIQIDFLTWVTKFLADISGRRRRQLADANSAANLSMLSSSNRRTARSAVPISSIGLVVAIPMTFIPPR
jgi:hypothetical protein